MAVSPFPTSVGDRLVQVQRKDRPDIPTDGIANVMKGVRRGRTEEACKADAEKRCTQVWRAHYASAYGDLEKARTGQGPLRERVERLRTQVRSLERQAGGGGASPQAPANDETVTAQVNAPEDTKVQWTPMMRLVVAGLTFGVLVLWTISVTVMGNYLIDSENPAFLPPNEWKAYMVSALPLAFPIVLEIWYLSSEPQMRERLRNIMIGLTVGASLAWLATFLLANPTPTNDPYGDLAATPNPMHAVWKGLNTAFQIFAELSASFVFIGWIAHLVEGRNNIRGELEARKQELSELEAQYAKQVQDVTALESFLRDGETEFCGRGSAFADACLNVAD